MYIDKVYLSLLLTFYNPSKDAWEAIHTFLGNMIEYITSAGLLIFIPTHWFLDFSLYESPLSITTY